MSDRYYFHGPHCECGEQHYPEDESKRNIILADELADAEDELTELRAVLAAMGAKKESSGWTMLNPHRDWHAWTEEEGYTCDACGDGPNCVFGFQSHIPIPNLAPVAGGSHE